MIEDKKFAESQRVTQFQKNKFGRQYYKDQVDSLDKMAYYNNSWSSETSGKVSSQKQKKVNYDLFNNIVDLSDFEYVCQPYGAEQGELPADLTNRDIISGKVKALLGMEEKRPFTFKVVATNDDATTRIETAEFEKIRDYVVKSIMDPIEQSIAEKAQAASQGRELNDQEKAQIQEQIQQQTEAMTPPEIATYMARVHQDPAEALAEQLLSVLTKRLDIKRKFNKGFKHACIAAGEIYHIGKENGHPAVTVVNPIYFDHDKSPDIDFIEDGETASCEYRFTPSQIVTMFGDELTDEQIDLIYTSYAQESSTISEGFWDFGNNENEEDTTTITVLHCVWKGLRKLGFLSYLDVNGDQQMKIVDETYKKNKDLGDLELTWKWLPEVHQGYKIRLSEPIYLKLGPLEGQFKDMDNLYECKLPYVGVVYDNLNSEATSIVDRIKAYQYYYNIIMYRVELLMASDKGKILMMNINSIPKSAGIDIKKWHYYAEATKVAWINPNEEGNKGIDVSQTNRVLDMSLASDINNYINLANYIERKAGEAVGIPKEMEAQINTQQAVSNVRQTINQASNILEPLFEMHNYVKRNVLARLLEVAKEAYSGTKSKMLRYVLDDMSIAMLELNTDLLSNSTYGLMVASSSTAHEGKELIKEIAHAGIQNQMINMSDIIKIIKSEGLQEAEDLLKKAEDEKRKQTNEQQTSMQEMQGKQQEQLLAAQQKMKEFDRETAYTLQDKKDAANLQRQTIMSMGFNEDKDVDRDGKPDILEVAQHGLDAEITVRKQNLNEAQFEQQKKIDDAKLKLEQQKLKDNKKK